MSYGEGTCKFCNNNAHALFRNFNTHLRLFWYSNEHLSHRFRTRYKTVPGPVKESNLQREMLLDH